LAFNCVNDDQLIKISDASTLLFRFRYDISIYLSITNKDSLFETCRLLSESVVWLYANDRVAEAEEIIRAAAKLNNITMPETILAPPAGTTETADTKSEQANDEGTENGGKLLDKLRNRKKSRISEKRGDARYSVLDVFRNRHLIIHTICMSFLWSVDFNVVFFIIIIFCPGTSFPWS